jgi:O-antigen ligase
MTFVLLLSVWLVPQAIMGGRLAQVVLFIPLLMLLAIAFLRWPGLTFPLLVITALLVPLSITTGTQSSINLVFPLVGLMILLWLFQKIGLKRQLRLLPVPFIIPLLIFIVISFIAFGFGQFNWLPTEPVPITAQIGGLAMFILTPGILLVTSHWLRDLRSLEWSTWLFLGLGGVFMLTLIIPSLERTGRDFFQRAVFDSLFWVWIAAIAFSQSLLNSQLKTGYRIILALIGLGGFYFTIIAQQAWVSGWFPAIIAILIIIGFRKPRLAIFGGIVASIFFLLQQDIVRSVFLTGDNEYSLVTRIEAWRIMAELIRLNPLLGLGPSNYYGYTPFYDLLGYNVNFNSHNNYIDIAAQIGIVGLAVFIWLAWTIGKTIQSRLNSVPEGFPRAYMYGAFGGFIGMLVAGMLGDWFLPFVYNIGLEGFRASSLAWMFVGGAIALYYIYHPNEDTERQSSGMNS